MNCTWKLILVYAEKGDLSGTLAAYHNKYERFVILEHINENKWALS